MAAQLSTLPDIAQTAGRPDPGQPNPRWTVRLLGAVVAESGGERLSHWPTRATAALLARLALHPDRDHPREELVELLWPGVALEVGRNRLRQALSALRSLLEPRDPLSAPVLQADRLSIRVLPGALDCDVRRFEACLRAGDSHGARQWYRGDFMPSWYEDWVVEERHRLAARHESLDASRTAAPPEPVASPPSGLPSYWTRAFGAEQMTALLQARVAMHRLVTVHGPGGSGKTRLAVAVAQSLREADASLRAANGLPGPFAKARAGLAFERIAFVSLVDCVDTRQVLDAVCAALQADAAGDPLTRIGVALAGRHTLLVLDNVEHLASGSGSQIAGLLSTAPELHVLVTSRCLLEVDGEQAFELEGLALPPADAALANAAVNPAVALFLDRARAAKADFALDARNLSCVVGLVRLLGGMPLAIELAASRMRSHTPRDLLNRLSVGAGTPMLDLLARGSGRATQDARHASMRHVVAWSWRQLRPAQAELLQGLSVCAGDAQWGAAAAVMAIDPALALTLLDELLDASLVRAAEGTDGSMRFGLLQPVREYAADSSTPAAARLARSRLRGWLTAQAGPLLARGPAAVAPEVAQLHGALLTAPADGEPEQALALAVALRSYWDIDHLPYSVLLALEVSLDAQAAMPAGDDNLRADAHELLSFARGVAGCSPEAIQHALAARALARDDRRRSLALARQAWAHYVAGQFDQPLEPLLDEAQALAERTGDLHAQATVVRMHSIVACNIRLDFDRTERLSATAQALWERLGNRPMAWLSLMNRAMMWGKTGRGNQDAVTVLGECERATRAGGDWPGLITCTRQLGRIHIRMRQWQPARAALQRSVQVAWQRHAALGLAHALLHLPITLLMCGQAEAAARLDGYAVAHWWRLFNGINRIEARELRRTRRLLRLALGGARAEALRVEGRSLDPSAAVLLALGALPA